MDTAALLSCLFLLMVTVGAENLCPKGHNTTSGLPRFVKVAKFLDVRIHHAQFIRCCAENYDSIEWFRNSLDKNKWVAYPWAAQNLLFDDQVLDIRSATIADNTTFQCRLIKDSVVKAQHVTRLWVDSCDELARGPRMIFPFPLDQYLMAEGVDIDLYCTGYFGCSNLSPGVQGLAAWYVRDVNTKKYTPAQEASSRYSVTPSNSSRFTVLGSVLHVQSVQSEDLHREFMCLLSSSQSLNSATNETVRIHIISKNIPLRWIIAGAVGVVALVLIVVIISCCTYRLCGPQIKWFCRSRMTCLGPKPYNDNEYAYNVFLYHAEESTNDLKLAASVRAELEKEHFNVRVSSDINAGMSLMEANQGEAVQSALIVFLYTEDLKRSRFAMFFLQNLVEYRNGKGILFLIVDKYKPEDVQNNTLRGAGGERHVENTGNDNHGDQTKVNGDQTKVKVNGDQTKVNGEGAKKQQDIDINFWKVLPRIQVPKDGASTRQKNRFHCALKNRVPLSENQLKHIRRKSLATDSVSSATRSSKGRSSSSGKPLLSSMCESPAGVCSIEPAAVSPNSDNVFIYDTNPIDSSLNQTIDRNLQKVDGIRSHVPEYSHGRTGKNATNTHPSNHVIVDVDVHNNGPEPESPSSLTVESLSSLTVETPSSLTVESPSSLTVESPSSLTVESPSSLTMESPSSLTRVFLMSGEEPQGNQDSILDLSSLNSPSFSSVLSETSGVPIVYPVNTRGKAPPGHGTLNIGNGKTCDNNPGELSPSRAGLKSDSSGYSSLSIGNSYHPPGNNDIGTRKPGLMSVNSDTFSEPISSPESGYGTSSSDRQSSDFTKKDLHQPIPEIEEVV